MNAAMRRGACPTLSTPMRTGDGLLVRLNPADGVLSPWQLAEVARAAARFGNGRMEITSKGSLQIRGLTASSAPQLAAFVDSLGIAVRSGIPVETAPLAGLDPDEIADPRPLAGAVRGGIARLGLAHRLGPKVTIVVDGGGHSMLDAVKADVRLTAKQTDTGTRWRLALAGDREGAMTLGTFEEAAACDAALDRLAAIAERGLEARARDLLHVDNRRARSVADHPLSHDTSKLDKTIRLTDSRFAIRISLPFGNVDATHFVGFADDLAGLGIAELRLSPDRSLFLLCPNEPSASSARRLATTFDLITDAADPRLSIVACAGAPACASAHFATKALADEIAIDAPHLLDGPFRLHLSGCDKRCAEPAGPSVALIGRHDGCTIVANGTSVPPALRNYLARRGLLGAHDRRLS
jgi:precorrin-3B synthase